MRNRLVIIRIYQAACPTNKCSMDLKICFLQNCTRISVLIYGQAVEEELEDEVRGGPILESRSMLFGQFVWKR